MDQLEGRILQTDQLKNASKRLQHHVNHTLTVLYCPCWKTFFVNLEKLRKLEI